MDRRRSVAFGSAALACCLALTTPSVAVAETQRLPTFSGIEFVKLIEIAMGRLPGLSGPGLPGPITGSSSLDSRIWERAFARGYQMRPVGSQNGMIWVDGLRLQPDAATAWVALKKAAKSAGHSLWAKSGHRSVNDQRVVFNERLKGTSNSAIDSTLAFHAPPGASRHHSGYAIDITLPGRELWQFRGTAAHSWLTANNFYNAKLFGFVPSYPAGVTNQGPNPEPWEFVYVGLDLIREPFADEMFFYRDDGLYRFYDIRPDGTLPAPMLSGDEYTARWDSITAIDLDGDLHDEMFFYRDDGLYRFYDIRPDGTLPAPMLSGAEYTAGWDSITAVDLDGDGQDEMFFYREDGLFRFYGVDFTGHLGAPIVSGDHYTIGWDSISSIDLDGDGQDEMFFYRNDGLYRFYDIRPDGTLPSPLLAGDEYTSGWDSITAIDLDGDGQDEMFFYRNDGLYRFYDIRPDGTLPSPLLAGEGYTNGWTSITAINLR